MQNKGCLHDHLLAGKQWVADELACPQCNGRLNHDCGSTEGERGTEPTRKSLLDEKNRFPRLRLKLEVVEGLGDGRCRRSRTFH